MTYQLQLRDDGILYVRFVGDVNVAEWLAYTQEYQTFLEAASAAEPLHFLVDAGEMGKISAAARQVAVGDLRDPDPRTGKTAMIGASRYLRVLVSFFLKAVGRDNIRLFETADEAVVWLKEEV